MPEEFIVADNLDKAWSNFDPIYPLPADCPFYVEREDKPLNKLKRALLREHRQPPKYFFSGHRGCGKSTELNILAADNEINQKFFVIKYSVKDVCDVNNLSYIDVLFSLGAQLFIGYSDTGKELRPELIKALEDWKNNVVEQVREEIDSFEGSIEAGLKGFFISVLGKFRSEDNTTKTIRTKIEPRLSELIEQINLIVADIEGKEKKKVLILIDDMDKPNLDQAKKIFYDYNTAITQPSCSIVFTVPISIFFSQEFTAIRETRFFIPNVKLHYKDDKNRKSEKGFKLMSSFIFLRMKEDLIEPDACEYAIKMGAGVFRETARIMQISADNAIAKERSRIIKEDVVRAESEIRSDFKRMLSSKDYDILKRVCKNNEMYGIEEIGHLLHNLSILEYMNDETWCDIHPTLEKLINL
ncbi:AAA ATPase domain protein [uncultured archaeon]|nr:AAA ATPase domain protein [uncultured archaeon]